MYKIKFLQISIIVVISTFVSFILVPAKAYADIDLGIYPPILQINATPPTSIRSPITIDNQGTDPVELQIVVKPFKQSETKNGQVEYLQEGDSYGNDAEIFNKMEILDHEEQVDSITLAPEQQKQLILHIALPKEEPAGDYYFSVVFISKDQSVEQSGSGIAGGIATNVLLSVGPQDKTTGNIITFSTPWIIQQGPVPFTLLVQNTSNHFTAPTGHIVINTIFGQTVGRLGLLPVNILQDSSRYIPDRNSANSTQAVWKEKALFGIYSAHLSILLSDQGPLFERTIYFIALPIEVVISIIVIILAVTSIVLRVRQKLKKG